MKKQKENGADEYDLAMAKEKKYELAEKRAELRKHLERLKLFNK